MTVPLFLDNWSPSTAMRQVRDGVAEVFGVEPHLLIGRGRRRPLVEYRHIAMWVIRECFPALSYPMIGQMFGSRDHSTVIHGVRNVIDRRARDPGFVQLTDALRDGFGVRKTGMVLDQELTLRIAEVAARVAPPPPDPAAEPPEPPRRAVKQRNDFSEDDSDAKARKAGSDALGAALAREGMVCR